MATLAKKKTSSKRAAKTAAKSSYGAATRSAKRISPTDWANQGATLLPFAQGFAQADMSEASKQAAENMMRMGSDVMQQFWNNAKSAAQNPEAVMSKMQAQANDVFAHAMPKMPSMPDFMPGFDAGQMHEKFTKFAQETSEQLSRAASGSGKAVNEAMDLSRENAEAMVEVMNVAVAMCKEMGAEAISCANKSFSRNVELSKEAFTCRTLNDVFDLMSRCLKSNLDGFFSQSVRFSEMLFQTATDVSEPINERISESADRMSKAMVA